LLGEGIKRPESDADHQTAISLHALIAWGSDVINLLKPNDIYIYIYIYVVPQR